MPLEGFGILKAAVNVKLVRIANRGKRAVGKAAGLLSGRSLDLEHRLLHFAALAGTSMKSSEHEDLHCRLPGTEEPPACYAAARLQW